MYRKSAKIVYTESWRDIFSARISRATFSTATSVIANNRTSWDLTERRDHMKGNVLGGLMAGLVAGGAALAFAAFGITAERTLALPKRP
jgi:hypothetical protein